MWYDEPGGDRSWGRCTPALTWQAAEDACVAEGGHLVSIRNAQDGIFAINVLTGVEEAWIGLNDLATPRMYEWTDGTPYEYMNWDDGQPDDPDHQCAGIGPSRRWFDYACDEERGFVCARPI
jgi:C-type mannose receptor